MSTLCFCTLARERLRSLTPEFAWNSDSGAVPARSLPGHHDTAPGIVDNAPVQSPSSGHLPGRGSAPWQRRL